MPTVTALTAQKRDPSRCNIYLDGDYVTAVSFDAVIRLGLKVGVELSDAQVATLEDGAQVERYVAMAVRYIGVRVRSEQEVKRHMGQKGASVEVVSQVIQRLRDSGLVDDLDFARRWVADRVALRPRSKRHLEQELLGKGVSRETVSRVLDEVDTETQSNVLERVLDKRWRTAAHDREKLLAYLLRQGFEYHEAKAAVDRRWQDEVE